MELLADIYVANDDAHALQYDIAPETFTDRIQYGTITELQLSMLWAIVQGVKWEAISMRQFANVFRTDDGEVLICRLPLAMPNDLLNLSAEQISSAAETWASTREMSCKPAEALGIVEGLILSARKAADTKRNVYLWNSV